MKISIQTDLKNFLDDVVDHEDEESDFAAHDEVAPGTHISKQLHCSKLRTWNGPAGRGELHYHPLQRRSNSQMEFIILEKFLTESNN